MLALIFGGETIFSLSCTSPGTTGRRSWKFLDFLTPTSRRGLRWLRHHGRERLIRRRQASQSDLGAEADDHLAGSNRCERQELDGLIRLR